jgi:hypothetical protein
MEKEQNMHASDRSTKSTTERSDVSPQRRAAPAKAKTRRAVQPFAEKYHVLVECAGEAQQEELYERLTSEGLECRLVML